MQVFLLISCERGNILDNVHIMIAMGKRCAKGIQPQYHLIVISFYEWGAIPPGSSIKESLYLHIHFLSYSSCTF